MRLSKLSKAVRFSPFCVRFRSETPKKPVFSAENDGKYRILLNARKLAKMGLTKGWVFAIIINVVARTANTLTKRQRRSLKTIQKRVNQEYKNSQISERVNACETIEAGSFGEWKAEIGEQDKD